MNTLQKFESRQLEKMKADKVIPAFSPGDTVKVNVKVREGTRERIQAYEGICIARSGSGMNESFTVRKISYGEGVERVFPLFSPQVASIELIRRGSVRRAKLYYLRDLRGKSARIVERTTGHGMDEESLETDAAAAAAAKEAEKAVKISAAQAQQNKKEKKKK